MPSEYNAPIALLTTFLPFLCILGFNCIFGAIAVSMAKKRGLLTTPAFFAGLFGSFVSLFFIAMFPIRDENTDPGRTDDN